MRIEDITIPGIGVALAATVYGDPTSPPVVLLHGGGQTRQSWQATAQRLALRGWRAIAVDLRGHGASEWAADGRYGLANFADDILNLSAVLHRRPVLVGFSLGGLAALTAVARCPGVASGLVLMDVSPFVQKSGADRVAGFMRANLDGFDSVQEAAAAVATYRRQRERQATANLRNSLREVDGRFFWHWDPALIESDSGAVGPALLDALSGEGGLQSMTSSLRLPTLLIRGARSDVLLPDDSRRFLERVPHADFSISAESGHLVVGDDNQGFDAALTDFLDRRIRPRLELFSTT